MARRLRTRFMTYLGEIENCGISSLDEHRILPLLNLFLSVSMPKSTVQIALCAVISLSTLTFALTHMKV